MGIIGNSKQLSDYLHLYLGCKIIMLNKATGEWSKIKKLTSNVLNQILMNDGGVNFSYQLILRSLDSMTEDECKECGNMIYDFSDDPELNNHQWKDFEGGLWPEQYHWLLSKHFDLFGLIKSGLAIDEKELSI